MSKTSPTHNLRDTLAFLGIVDPTELDDFPDFLVIGPPKTGTTWLARHLSQHPGIFVPAMKEVKYFNFYWKSRDLPWYLSVFREGRGRLKGDVTPNYAILPSSTIRLIHDLRPHLKLIFLMRDPVERAWSQARWDHRHRDSCFSSFDGTIEDVTAALWQESFSSPRSVLFGDYLGQLQRWLEVFDRRQLHLAFTEQAHLKPAEFLNAIFDFLGVERSVALNEASLKERVNVSSPRSLTPELLDCLRRIYGPRTRQLVDFMRREFAIDPPAEWNNTLALPGPCGLALHDARDGGPEDLDHLAMQSIDDDQLEYFLHQEELRHPHVVDSCPEWHIVEFRGQFYGVPQSIGDIDFFDRAQRTRPEVLTAPTASEIREQIEEILRNASAPEVDPPVLVDQAYDGYNIVHYEGRFFALSRSLGPVDVTQIDDHWRGTLRQPCDAFVAETLVDARRQVDHQLTIDEFRKLVGQVEEQISQLARQHQQLQGITLDQLQQNLRVLHEDVSLLDWKIERLTEQAWTWRKIFVDNRAARLFRTFLPNALVASIRGWRRHRQSPEREDTAALDSRAVDEPRKAA